MPGTAINRIYAGPSAYDIWKDLSSEDRSEAFEIAKKDNHADHGWAKLGSERLVDIPESIFWNLNVASFLRKIPLIGKYLARSQIRDAQKYADLARRSGHPVDMRAMAMQSDFDVFEILPKK